MTGILFFAVVGLWFWVCIVLARRLMRRVSGQPWRFLAGLMVFVVLLLAPVADEILGRFQFRALCEKHAMLKIDAMKVRGRTLKQIAVQSFPSGTILRIEQWSNSFRDTTSGEEMASFGWLRTRGGWLIRALGLSEGNAPLLISPASCWPKMEGRLEDVYQFTLIKD